MKKIFCPFFFSFIRFVFTISTFLNSFFSIFVVFFSLLFVWKNFISNRNLTKLDYKLSYKFRIPSFIWMIFSYILFIWLANLFLRSILINFQYLIIFSCINITNSLLIYLITTFYFLFFFKISFDSIRKITKEKRHF